jgi:limonene-1,2-epoxide hydrolase
MTTPEQIVLTFIGHMNANRIDDALQLLAEDVFYHNIPMEPIIGREAVRAFNAEFAVGTSVFADWEVVAIATAGDVVLTERIDAFTNNDGRRISIPVMGSFRIRDGLIAEWSDYFDLG